MAIAAVLKPCNAPFRTAPHRRKCVSLHAESHTGPRAIDPNRARRRTTPPQTRPQTRPQTCLGRGEPRPTVSHHARLASLSTRTTAAFAVVASFWRV